VERAVPKRGSIDWLIQPVEKTTFFSEYWETRPLLVHREAPGHLDGLLTIADVDELIGSGRVAYPTLRLVRQGVETPPGDYEVEFRNTSGVERLADPGKVADHFRNGGTVSLNQVHRVFAGVADLCARLEGDLSHTVESNLYLTPPHAQGAPSHYDVVDVFVLQVEGRKTWRVYEDPPVPLPLPTDRAQRGADPGRAATLLFETELHRGDVLYLPRGWVHEARTTSETSLHLTVVVDVLRYADLARMLLEDASRSGGGLRRALPPGFLGPAAGVDVMRRELASLLDAALDPEALTSVVRRLRQKRRSAPRFLIGGRLLQAEAAERATPVTPVRRRDGLPLEIEASDPGITLHFAGRSVELPSFAQPVLDLTLSDRAFRAVDAEPRLDAGTALTLLRSLVREGVLVIDLATEPPDGAGASRSRSSTSSTNP